MIRRALVIGAAHGNLGDRIADELLDYNEVHRADKRSNNKPLSHIINIYNDRDIAHLIDRLWPLDLVIYSAGVNKMGSIKEYDVIELINHLNVNMIGAFVTIQSYVNSLEIHEAKYGRAYGLQKKIIIITSNTAFIPRTRSVAYCTSKAAANMLVQQAHRELAPEGYKIIGFAPGVIEDTYMHRRTHEELLKLRGWDETECVRQRTSNIPMRRFTTTRECAKVVKFLASPAGDYFGGEIVRFDGGEK